MEINNNPNIQEILKKHAVRQAYLFGSHARGTAGPLSDIDIAIMYPQSVDKESAESKLFADLSQLLRTDNIDLVDIETASPLLAHRAVICGIPFLDHSRHDEAVLKTKILHDYEDTRHLRKIKEKAFV